MDIQKLFEELYVKNAPSWSIERDPDSSYKYHATKSAFVLFENQQLEIESLKSELVKAQAVPEGFVLVNAEQLNQWGHMANAAEQYGCCDCFESRGYAHNLACEINSYFEPVEAQEQSHDS